MHFTAREVAPVGKGRSHRGRSISGVASYPVVARTKGLPVVGGNGPNQGPTAREGTTIRWNLSVRTKLLRSNCGTCGFRAAVPYACHRRFCEPRLISRRNVARDLTQRPMTRDARDLTRATACLCETAAGAFAQAVRNAALRELSRVYRAGEPHSERWRGAKGSTSDGLEDCAIVRRRTGQRRCKVGM